MSSRMCGVRGSYLGIRLFLTGFDRLTYFSLELGGGEASGAAAAFLVGGTEKKFGRHSGALTSGVLQKLGSSNWSWATQSLDW